MPRHSRNSAGYSRNLKLGFDIKDFYVLDYNKIKIYKNKISENYKKGKR